MRIGDLYPHFLPLTLALVLHLHLPVEDLHIFVTDFQASVVVLLAPLL